MEGKINEQDKTHNCLINNDNVTVSRQRGDNITMVTIHVSKHHGWSNTHSQTAVYLEYT